MNTTRSEDRITSLSIALRPECPAVLRRGAACNEVRLEEARPGVGAGFTYCGTPFFLKVRHTRRLKFDGADVQLHLLSVSELDNARVVLYAPRSVRVIRPFRQPEDAKGVA